jgi:hypothetical protein
MCAGRVIEPRKQVIESADAVGIAEGSTNPSVWPDGEDSPGSKSGACTRTDPLGTWEIYAPPHQEVPLSEGEPKQAGRAPRSQSES